MGLGDFMNIYKEIEKHITENERVIIAIDGPSGSGKSTISNVLEKQYDCLVFHIDDYFLPTEMKTKERLDKPGGNFHHERLIDEVFNNIHNKKIVKNSFNCTTQQLGTPLQIDNNKIIIVEGVYAQHPLLADFYTMKIFLEVDSDTQLRRILKRNGDRMLQKWIQEWIPLENDYFNAYSIQKKADFRFKL